MDSSKVLSNLESFDVVPLDGSEQLDEYLLEIFTQMFEHLVEAGELSALLSMISVVEALEANAPTTCAIMYVMSIFIEEATKNF